MTNSKDKVPEFMKKTIPMALAEGMKAQLVSYLCSIHCVWKILLVGKNKENSIPQLVLKGGKRHLKMAIEKLLVFMPYELTVETNACYTYSKHISNAR